MQTESGNQKNQKVQEKAPTNVLMEGFNLKRFLMEFIGTFAIVYFGNWASIFKDLGQGNNVAVALTVGFITTVFTWIGAGISGAHFNPITTMSMIFLKKIGWSTGCIYWVFQILGAIIAGSMIYLQVPPEMLKSLVRNNGLGIPTPDRKYLGEAVWSELMATFFFQLAFIVLLLDKRAPKEVYAIGAGGMMAVGIIISGTVSGGGLNPARVFGPAIITSGLNSDILVHIGGPLAGALIAAFLYKSVLKEKDEAVDEDSSSEEDFGTVTKHHDGKPDDEAKSDEDEANSQELEIKNKEEAEIQGRKIKSMNKDEKLKMVFNRELGPEDEEGN